VACCSKNFSKDW